MREWWTEAGEAARNTVTLTDTNRLVLAYQFERARLMHPQGFTMNLMGELISPDQGYAVGIMPDAFETVGDALDTLARIQDVLGWQNLCLGYWSQDGRDYIDVTVVTQSWEMAENLGRKARQLAIWDFSTGSEILLNNPHDGMVEAA